MYKKTVISIDVGGTKISGGIVTEDGKIRYFIKESTNRDGGYKVVKQIVQMIEYLISMIEGTKSIVGVGISVPGIVINNVVIMTPNIRGWENIALAKLLESELKRKIPIVIIDDRIAVALGEHWLGAAKNKKNAVIIIIGTGVGAGIIIDGYPYFGSTGVAGAIGWWITNRKEELIKETKKGFLEEKISGPGIAKKAIIELKKQKKKTKTLLVDMCENRLERITSEMVFNAAKKGDSFAKEIIEDAATNLGVAISNIVSILNPEVVVITGGVGKEFANFSTVINSIVRKFSQPYAVKNVKIAYSKLGYNAYLLGVAKYVLEKYA
ncbi:MAG: ROK family protein [Candidatus Micrarchaeia archaeon]